MGKFREKREELGKIGKFWVKIRNVGFKSENLGKFWVKRGKIEEI